MSKQCHLGCRQSRPHYRQSRPMLPLYKSSRQHRPRKFPLRVILTRIECNVDHASPFKKRNVCSALGSENERLEGEGRECAGWTVECRRGGGQEARGVVRPGEGNRAQQWFSSCRTALFPRSERLR